MASEKSVYLVYSCVDGVEWSSYLANLLTQVELDVTSVELGSSGSLSLPASLSRSRRRAVIVLLASPGFLKSLIVDQSDSLDALVNQSPTDLVVLFLCGPLMNDLEETDRRGRRLSERFPGLANWTKLTHDDLKQLPRTVCDLLERAARKPASTTKSRPPREAQKTTVANKKQPKLRPKTNFKLVPDEVRCEVCICARLTTNDVLQQSRRRRYGAAT